MEIKYLKGDATRPIGNGDIIIAHVCNDIGAFGAGFSGAIARRWKIVETSYRNLTTRTLGDVQFIQLTPNLMAANMIAQHDVINILGETKDGLPPIRYDALRQCLIVVNGMAVKINATLHCPRFGAGLSGGDWNIVEQIIKDIMSVDVYVYDLK